MCCGGAEACPPPVSVRFCVLQVQGEAGKLSEGTHPLHPPLPALLTPRPHPTPPTSLTHPPLPTHPHPELYPQVLGKSALLNAPRFFSAVFSLFRVFLTAK